MLVKELLILAIETTLRKPSISILKDESEISVWTGDLNVTSSRDLLPAIGELLDKNHFSLNEIDLCAVSRGPGSFTGIRVGLATAQALAYSSGCSCCGVSVLEAMALTSVNPGANSKKIITVIPAGRDQVYWQSFHGKEIAVREKSEPALEDFTDFLQRIAELSGTFRVEIIVQETISEEICSFATKENKSVSVTVASDNISRYIGLLGGELFEKCKAKQVSVESLNLSPLYIRQFRKGD